MQRSASIGNKTTYQRTVNKNYVLHLERLQKIKSSSSQTLQLQNQNSQLNKKTTLLRHNNKKKELEEELNHIKIDRENKILLDKMTKIVSRSTVENFAKGGNKIEARARSLNENFRKQELEKIMIQNQGIINRLRQQTSFYNIKNWEKDHKMRETYLKNMAEYSLREGFINAQTERAMRRTMMASDTESPTRRSSVEKRGKLSFTLKNSLSSLPSRAGTHSRTDSTARKQVVHKKESLLNGIYYFIEFSFFDGNFQIALYRKDDLEVKYITLDEQRGRHLLLENNNRYDKIISKIDFKDGQPFIKGFGIDSILHESTKIELFNSFPNGEDGTKTENLEKTELQKEDFKGEDEIIEGNNRISELQTA